MPENLPPLTLFGAPVGMWTGKIRSYLRKQGIPFVERFPSDPVFEREVMPAVKRFINPVIRLADGTLVQDTADIIDHFEAAGSIRFSVYPQTTQPVVEAAYEALLSALDGHFRSVPYVLGGLPTLADFGFIANFYAHLGRDPYPSHQMKLSAPSVYRWTERMMASDADMPEFPQATQMLLPDDAIPETLGPVLQCMATDYLPELRMIVRCTDEWLATQPPIPAGAPVTSKPSARVLTRGRFLLRGTELESMVAPYTLTRLQRVTDTYAGFSEIEQGRVEDYFSSHGLADLLTLKARRRVERKGHLEVWG